MAGRADKHVELHVREARMLGQLQGERRKEQFKRHREDLAAAKGSDKLFAAQAYKNLQEQFGNAGARAFSNSFRQKQKRRRKQLKQLRSH